MTGARIAVKNLDHNVSKQGIRTTEQYAPKLTGWPMTILMPADLKLMLEANSLRKPDKIEQFGGDK